MCQYCKEPEDITSEGISNIPIMEYDGGKIRYYWSFTISDNSISLTPEFIVDISEIKSFAYAPLSKPIINNELHCIVCGRELKQIRINVPRKVFKYHTNIKELRNIENQIKKESTKCIL